MRHFGVFVGALILFLPSTSFAKGWVFRLSKAKTGAIAEVEPYSHYPGQALVLLKSGKEVGRAKLLRFTKKDERYALIQLVSGELSEGLIIEDADLFDDGISSVEKRKQKEQEEAPPEEPIEDLENPPDPEHHGFFASLLGGYDYEVLEDGLDGGLSVGLIAAYKTRGSFSLGARLGYSRISTPSTTVTVNRVSSTVNPPDLAVTYMLARAGVHPSNRFYVGALGGMVRTSAGSSSETHPGFGGEVSVNFPLTLKIALTINASSIYVLDDDSDYLSAAAHAGVTFLF